MDAELEQTKDLQTEQQWVLQTDRLLVLRMAKYLESSLELPLVADWVQTSARLMA